MKRLIASFGLLALLVASVVFAQDIPVPGKYKITDGGKADVIDGGKTAITIYRDGMWYILNPASDSSASIQWGTLGDVPVPSDYDGDG